MAAEKNFEYRVKKFLMDEGIYTLGTGRDKMKVPPCGYWEKRWGGGTFTKSGMPDMHITVCGKSVEVELKAPNGKPSALQGQKIDQINESGGIGLVLYPKDFDEFKKLIRDMKGKVVKSSENQ